MTAYNKHVSLLQTLHSQITAICNPPCLHGGTCSNSRTCQCPSTYTGRECETRMYINSFRYKDPDPLDFNTIGIIVMVL